MTALNLSATTTEFVILKDYLENNVSEVLADKINNGVRIEKDGKTLLSKKDLSSFMNYACEEAKKQAEQGARFACVDHTTVFNWAIHYFEEDSIEGTLYNEDGTEYKPQKISTIKPVTKPSVTSPTISKPSMFDLINSGEPPQANQVECVEPTKSVEEDFDSFSDAEITEILDEIHEEESNKAKNESKSEIIETENNRQNCPTYPTKASKMLDENIMVDEDGVVHKITPTTKDCSILSVLKNIFGDMLIAR
ncbi:MAG: PcfK-like family protein [Firmicutes bacterium]|nr:PcfK-like family protein [Bacillota bacterium]